jgi:hypothetical protein
MAPRLLFRACNVCGLTSSPPYRFRPFSSIMICNHRSVHRAGHDLRPLFCVRPPKKPLNQARYLTSQSRATLVPSSTAGHWKKEAGMTYYYVHCIVITRCWYNTCAAALQVARASLASSFITLVANAFSLVHHNLMHTRAPAAR